MSYVIIIMMKQIIGLSGSLKQLWERQSYEVQMRPLK